MTFKLVGFQIHFRLENYKFLLQAFLIGAQEMILSEMLLQRIVVLIVLLLSPFVSSITYMTSFMLVSTMGVKFVITIKSLPAEPTFWVPFESTLINSTRIVIAKFLMFSELLWCEQLMLMSEDLFVPRTEITQLFMVSGLHMPMEIWPAPTSDIAIGSWTIITKQQDCIVVYFLMLVLDPQHFVSLLKVSVHKVLVAFVSIVCEYHEFCLCLSFVSQ